MGQLYGVARGETASKLRHYPPVSALSFGNRLYASICFGGLAVTITVGRGLDAGGSFRLGFGLRA